MDVVPPLVANPKATILMQPAQGPLHHPAEYTQTTAVLRPALGQHRLDPEFAQALPVRFRVVTPVALHPIGPTAGNIVFAIDAPICTEAMAASTRIMGSRVDIRLG